MTVFDQNKVWVTGGLVMVLLIEGGEVDVMIWGWEAVVDEEAVVGDAAMVDVGQSKLWAKRT